MKIATAVVVEYGALVNPEPGVRRAPTVDEQVAAVEQHAVRHGLLVNAEPVVLEPDELPAPDLLSREHGVVCSTLSVLQRDGIVDLALLDAWRACGRPMGFIIEDLWFPGEDDDADFERFRTMVLATNLVRGRGGISV